MEDLQIVLMGPPGAGKSTQSRLLSNDYQIKHIQTGKLLRENKDMVTEWGKPKEYIDQGEMVPNPIIDRMVSQEISDSEGFILDGYPRDTSQAAIVEKEASIDGVFYLSVSKDILTERLKYRIVCDECGAIYNTKTRSKGKLEDCHDCGGNLSQRADDSPGSIRKRIEEYQSKTAPVVESYRKQGVLNELEADQEVEAVFNSIQQEIGKRR
ncbi:nucleoside monophosphate kinase [Halobacteria archaeon HArc-gm2]|nr:nucleoside monophosphate kinase [Halobacteria archaeon HArc-gm2]